MPEPAGCIFLFVGHLLYYGETNPNGRYAIIICSLKKQSQVAQYFQENKDINPANVIKKNGYYMIYFNRGDNYQELVKEAKQMPKPYTEFWITQV